MKYVGKLLIGFIIFCCIFAIGQPLFYNRYYNSMQKEFKVEGLKNGVIPQGMTYVEEYDAWLYTNYMKNHSASRLYVMKDGNYRFIELYTDEGIYDGHAGGISYANDLVYIASGGYGEDNCVYILSLSDVLNENINKIVMSQYFHPYTAASYCYAHDDILWVGEFEDGGKFLTDKSHHIQGNRALLVGYDINEQGLVDEKVDYVLSTGARVQGMAIDKEGRIAISTSYGIISSHLKLYSSLEKQEKYNYMIEYEEVPMWVLNNASCIFDVKSPQMAEGIVFKDERLYVIYESATLKYFFGILTKGRYVHSFDFFGLKI